MHECNAMQLLETRRKNTKNQRAKNNGHKGKAMKHKDYVRKTQLDAPRALEFVFTLE